MSNKDESKSKGGKARAESLSSEERKAIASKAAKDKWSNPRALYGSPDKKLKLGARELECYVLEDGKRVLSGRGMQEAMGLGQSHGGILKEFTSQKALIGFISNKLAMELNSPIRFIRPGRGGVLASGFEAHLLPDICDAILESRDRGALTGKRQREVAKQCEIIVRALSRVGITALIDEVTGYQEIRDREALQKILDKYITDEMAKWTKTFPDEFYQELFRLKGLDYPTASGQKPSYVGHWTNDIIYDRLAPGVKAALKKKNPRQTKTGARKHKHHQYLTRDYGHPELKELLSNVIFMMRACNDWDQFKTMLDKAREKYGSTIEMDI
ncbi:MAG: P63C domain-containing protein [Candidatus Thiodiazotropha sp.]